MTEKQICYNKTEVAKYLGISRQYLHRLERHVKLPREQGTHIGRITLSEIDEWVEENWTVSYYKTQKYFRQKQAQVSS